MGCISSTNNADDRNPNFELMSSAVKRNVPDEYYINQANEYFNSLDTTKREYMPKYNQNVARFEWPPWLLLTGLGKERTIAIDEAIRLMGPCVCVDRNHKLFASNPFVRSVITFYYGKEDIEKKIHPVRIYEEFTFNSIGEITFVEAWWDNNYKVLIYIFPFDNLKINDIDCTTGFASSSFSRWLAK